MFQLRQDLPLPPKPLIGINVATSAGNQLDRHAFVVFAISPVRQVHHAHAAAPDLVQDVIRPDLPRSLLRCIRPECRSRQQSRIELIRLTLHR